MLPTNHPTTISMIHPTVLWNPLIGVVAVLAD
jgi:hypothetical protein